MTIKSDMIQAGIEIDTYESDLYVPDCPEARAILANHGKQVDGWNVTQFRDNRTGAKWLDIALSN